MKELNFANTKIVLTDTFRDIRLCGAIFSKHVPPEKKDAVEAVVNRAVIFKLIPKWNITNHKTITRFGFLVFEFSFEKPIVHFVYTHEKYRGQGVAKALIEYALIFPSFYYTFPTDKKIRGGTYQPQLLTKPWSNI